MKKYADGIIDSECRFYLLSWEPCGGFPSGEYLTSRPNDIQNRTN